MSVEVETLGHAHQHLSHQFEDLEQQNECYIVGMWTFLVTEIMFFGALFLALTIYRGTYTEDFHLAHTSLNIPLGLTNTFILLTSSLLMALCVRGAQLGNRLQTQLFMGLTMLCAFGFLGVKAVEYSQEFSEHHLPGPNFSFSEAGGSRAETSATHGPTTQTMSMLKPESSKYAQPPSQDRKQLFFCLYFIMTGLHGIHVIIGILIMGVLFFMVKFKHPAVEDYMPIEMTGLYWHFVDIVWIFLFPLIYLIGQSH